MANKLITKREDLNYDSPDYFIDIVRVEHYEKIEAEKQKEEVEKPFVQRLMEMIPGDKEVKKPVQAPVQRTYPIIERTYGNTIVSDATQDLILTADYRDWIYHDDKDPAFKRHITDMKCPKCGRNVYIKKWDNGRIALSCHDGWLDRAVRCTHYSPIKNS